MILTRIVRNWILKLIQRALQTLEVTLKILKILSGNFYQQHLENTLTLQERKAYFDFRPIMLRSSYCCRKVKYSSNDTCQHTLEFEYLLKSRKKHKRHFNPVPIWFNTFLNKTKIFLHYEFLKILQYLRTSIFVHTVCTSIVLFKIEIAKFSCVKYTILSL